MMESLNDVGLAMLETNKGGDGEKESEDENWKKRSLHMLPTVRVTSLGRIWAPCGFVNLGTMEFLSAIPRYPFVDVSLRLSSVNDRRSALQGKIIFGDWENLHEGCVKFGDDLGVI